MAIIYDGDDDGDEDDAQSSKDLSPFSCCVVVMVEIFTVAIMDAVERQGTAVVARMSISFSLGPPPLHRPRRAPRTSQYHPYGLGKP
jgi:hypothetical protein